MDAADPRAAGGDTEPCATCGAPMDSPQRYCLSCGARRAHLGGVREGLRVTAGSDAATREAAAREAAPHGASATVPGTLPGASVSLAPGASAPFGAPTRGSGATVVIACVGVLLLAMGVGVLIGRTGSNAGRVATAPQVISVASPGAGATGATGSAGGAATTPTTSTPSNAAPPKQSKPSGSGVGAVPSKPAPPTALKNLRTGGSGQSYEQKSKNLPNVVSTG
jgi:hypothetical protein